MDKLGREGKSLGRGPTEGILLGAGCSVRMGGLKQLAQLHGKPLLAWAVENALSSSLERVHVVLGEGASEIAIAMEGLLAHPRVRVILNPGFREGIGSSIRAAMVNLLPESNSVMILLGDQPFVWPHIIDQLLERFYKSDSEICVPLFGGKRGNPVIFGRPFFEELARLRGDVGGRLILERNPGALLQVEVKDPGVLWDVDTEEDLERARRMIPDGSQRRGG